jgi:hypothetical protein
MPAVRKTSQTRSCTPMREGGRCRLLFVFAPAELTITFFGGESRAAFRLMRTLVT